MHLSSNPAITIFLCLLKYKILVVCVLSQVPSNAMEPEPASLANDFVDGNREDLEMIKHLEELKLKLSELELKICQVSLPYKNCSHIMNSEHNDEVERFSRNLI